MLSQNSKSRQIFNELGVSLYVHYPFCVHKCPYCDFASVGLGADINRDQLYIAALISEFEQKIPLLQGAHLCSVYIGGGTPSLCEPSLWQQLLDVVRPHLALDAEISLEVNPGTVSYSKLTALRQAGFNRISLGVQSFNDLALKRIGRIHDRKVALQACDWALSCFDDVNLDIMHGLPKQSIEDALADLKQLIEFKPTHLSWYELTLEEDTAFGQHPPVLPDEDVLLAIEEQGFDLLEQAGYEHYEVSGYNAGGKMRCLHNQNYWLYGDYLGIGAGAHQKISIPHIITPHWRSQDSFKLNTFNQVNERFSIYRKANPEDYTSYLLQQITLANLINSPAANTLLKLAKTSTIPLTVGANLDLAVKPIKFKQYTQNDGTKSLAENADNDKNELNYISVEILGEKVAQEQIPFEFMLNRLRLWLDPFSLSDIDFRIGFHEPQIAAKLQNLQEQGLFVAVHNNTNAQSDLSAIQSTFMPSDLGRRMLNDIIYEFIDE